MARQFEYTSPMRNFMKSRPEFLELFYEYRRKDRPRERKSCDGHKNEKKKAWQNNQWKERRRTESSTQKRGGSNAISRNFNFREPKCVQVNTATRKQTNYKSITKHHH